MDNKKWQDAICTIMNESRVGILSTIRENMPYSRYMIFRNEGLMLYCVSSRRTNKVRDIEKNQHVHILLGFESISSPKPYLEITAIATIREDKDYKQRLWNDNFLKYLTGPDDPDYTIIVCEPKCITLVNHPERTNSFTWELHHSN